MVVALSASACSDRTKSREAGTALAEELGDLMGLVFRVETDQVDRLALELGRSLGLPPARLQNLEIGGYLHVYSGQEAVASGVIGALRKDDIVFSGYRDHAHALALGSDPGRVMAELFGKATGIAKGKGGSMHLFDVEHGFYGGYGIVGGHLTLATGAAYALRYRDTDRIAVCYFGDGAMNIGSFHEAMNMAGLWGKQGMCPIIFVIENNGYAMGTSVERHSALTDLAARVRAYNIQGEKVDGQDVFAVRGVADRVARQVRETGVPYCIEAVTYRFSGHGAADFLQPHFPGANNRTRLT